MSDRLLGFHQSDRERLAEMAASLSNLTQEMTRMSAAEDALKTAVATLVTDVSNSNTEIAKLAKQLADLTASGGDSVPSADVQAITQQILAANASMEQALAAATPAPAAPPAPAAG